MADGFVVLQSYVDSINLLPPERRWPFFEELFCYRMTGEEPKPETDLERMALVNIFPVVDKSVERYEKNKENGQKGGRPKKWIPPEEWRAYRKSHSQQETADHFGISLRTLRNWEGAKTGKNQDIDKDIDSDIDTDKDIDINESIKKKNKKEKAETPETLKGVPAIRPCQPGWEFVKDGLRYRFNDRKEIECIGKV